MDVIPMMETLKTPSKFSEQAIERDWLSVSDFTTIKPYIGNLQKLAQFYRDRAFEHMLWEVVGCEATLACRDAGGRAQSLGSEPQP